jgi:hypothetical protein
MLALDSDYESITAATGGRGLDQRPTAPKSRLPTAGRGRRNRRIGSDEVKVTRLDPEP